MKDPRDRLLDVALAFAFTRERRRLLGRAIRLRRCERSSTRDAQCFGRDDAWRLAEDTSHYCGPCQANVEPTRERHLLRATELSLLAKLERAVAAFRTAEHNERFLPMFERRAAS